MSVWSPQLDVHALGWPDAHRARLCRRLLGDQDRLAGGQALDLIWTGTYRPKSIRGRIAGLTRALSVPRPCLALLRGRSCTLRD